jgi:hypothetical protein
MAGADRTVMGADRIVTAPRTSRNRQLMTARYFPSTFST